MWNSIVRRFTLDDEFSFLLLNLSISRISIPGKFSYIFTFESSWNDRDQASPKQSLEQPRSRGSPVPLLLGPRVGRDHGNKVVPRYNSKQYSTMLQGVPGASQIKDWMHRSGAFHFTPNRNFRKLLLNFFLLSLSKHCIDSIKQIKKFLSYTL